MLCAATLVVIAATSTESPERRVVALEAQVAALMEELSSVKVTVSRHEQQLSQAAHVGVVQKDSHDSGRDEQGQSTVRADVDESGHTHMGGRRLQGSSEYAAVPAWQVHEFPSGHTCGTGARIQQARCPHADGRLSRGQGNRQGG